MKIRIIAAVTALTLAVSTTSCMTTYDAYGRPVQSVDPGLAVAGIAAAGLVGYALADGNDNHHHDNRYYHNSGYRRANYGHGYHAPTYAPRAYTRPTYYQDCGPVGPEYPGW